MKKTKLMTKVMAVVFALAILFAMSVPVFADDITQGTKNDKYQGSQAAGFGLDANNSTHILITKAIVAFNPDNVAVREPNMDYTYTAVPYDTNTAEGAELNATITDAGDNTVNPARAPKTVTVLNGMVNGVTAATIQFRPTNTKVQAAQKGTEFEHTSYFTVDLNEFTHAGVYRYKITETMSVNGTAVTNLENYGFEARGSGYSAERYLDVYIVNDANGTNGLAVQAAIMFKTTATDTNNPANAATDAITTTTEKTTGYEPGVEPDPNTGDYDYTNDGTVDRYKTYNLEVGKTIEGGLADKNHYFPFVITLAADANLVPTVTADFVNNNATSLSGVSQNNTIDITTNSNTVVGASMSNGDSITINGLPKGTTVTVKETNDTHDEYTASWDTMSGTTTSNVTFKDANNATVNSGYAIANNASITTSAVAIDGDSGYVKTELGYTNTISELSPTGLAFRIAPYVLMLAAGISLVLLFAKRRREITDMI